jgi:hypothetical protein
MNAADPDVPSTTAALPAPSSAAWPALASALLAVALYAVTLAGTYVYDDVAIVRDDPRVRHAGQWGRLWTSGYFDGGLDNLYRPLTSTSYAVQWWLHGDRPWAFHAVNVLLHAAVAAAVALVAYRATGRAAAAWGAGLIFAAHPIHVEAVANIVGRAELAAALPLLGSLALLARRPLTPARAAAVLACGVVAVLCKEQGLIAPALWVLVATLLWTARPTGRERSVATGSAVLTLWAWAAYLLLREHFLRFDWDRGLLDRAVQPMFRSAGVDRWLLPVALLGRYAVLLAWPAHPSPDYGGDVIGSAWHSADPYFWIGLAVAVAWAAGAGVAIRRLAGELARRGPAEGPRPSVRGPNSALFSLLAMAVSYALVGNLLTIIGTIFAERLAYLTSAFAAVLVGWALCRLRPRLRVALLATVLVPMSIQTVRSAVEWNHPRALFARALADHPGSINLHLLLADADRQAGLEADRRAVLTDACRRFPDYWRCWGDLARADADAGRFDAAEYDLRRAMAIAFSPNLQSPRSYVSEREAAAGWRP